MPRRRRRARRDRARHGELDRSGVAGSPRGGSRVGAALVILSKRLLAAATPPLTVAFWDCLVGTVAVAPVLLLADRVLPSGREEWAVALTLGVVFTGLSTLVYATLLRRVTAQAAGVLTFLEPVAGVLLAWAIVEARVADAPAGVGSGAT